MQIIIVSFSSSVTEKFDQRIKVFVEVVHFLKMLAERCIMECPKI